MVERVYVEREPIYLRVPLGHARNWPKFCSRYNAAVNLSTLYRITGIRIIMLHTIGNSTLITVMSDGKIAVNMEMNIMMSTEMTVVVIGIMMVEATVKTIVTMVMASIKTMAKTTRDSLYTDSCMSSALCAI